MELSVDEMEEWTEVLCELIGRHSFLTYPTEWLAMESADVLDKPEGARVPQGRPPRHSRAPRTSFSVHTSQRAWITKPVAENPPAAGGGGE